MKPVAYSALIFSALVFACQVGPDRYMTYAPELPAVAIDKCYEANKDNISGLTREDCNLKNCLANPIVLQGMDFLLSSTDTILKDNGVRYWLDSGTLLGAFRFAGYLPWDDDVDVAVVGTDLEPKLDTLRKAFESSGFTFIAHNSSLTQSFQNFTDGAAWWQIWLTRSTFQHVALLANPSMSLDEIDRAFEFYLRNDTIPHLDIFIFDLYPDGNYHIRADAFSSSLPNGIPPNVIFPLSVSAVLDKNYPVPADVLNYLVAWYKTNKIKYDVVMNAAFHAARCSLKYRFKDIRTQQELLTYFSDYFKYVFGSRFTGFPTDITTPPPPTP